MRERPENGPAASEFLVLFELCTVLDKSALDIDLDAGFISNGGDSLGAAALTAACKNHGLSLPRDKILKSQTLRSIFSAISCPTDEETARVKNYLLYKLALGTTELSAVSSTSSNTTQSVGLDTKPISQWPASGTASYPESAVEPGSLRTRDASLSTLSLEPLTEMQLIFIRGSLRQPGTNVIIHSETYKTDNIPALKEAWRQVIESEPIFSRDFPNHQALSTDSTGFNWVESGADFADQNRPAGPSIGSFFRVTPIHCPSGPSLSKITWTVHHALIDGYSASVLLDKVLRIANHEPSPPPGPSFSQSTRELDLFRRANREAGDAYWASRQADLSEAHHELLLPHANPQDGYTGSSTFTINITSVAQDIQSRAKSIGIAPASFFKAAWALTLALYADSDLVSFGAVLCGRNLPIPGAFHVVGPLLNTLPLAIGVDRSKTAEEFLQSTFDKVVELEEYQWTTTENGFRRGFDTALSVQLDLPDLPARRIRPLSRQTRQEHELPLGIRIDPRREVSFDYHVHRFSKENVQRLGETYHRALSLLLGPGRTLDDILRHLIPASYVELLQQFGNCSSSTLTRSVKEDLVTLFERRAREMPDNLAIEKGCDRMSYREMDDVASRVAFRLSRHISAGEAVCVYSDQSMLWLCAIFGILKAGGVYCSVDPRAPDEVRDRIFGLSGAKTFITAKACQLKIVPEGCAVSFTVQSTTDPARFEALEHRRVARPQSPAYVCFTSGSTGTPKGVLCAHAGLVAFQSSLDVRLFAAPGRRIAQVMSVAFDGSIHELFSALTYGATLVLPSGSDPFGHLRSVDSAALTPSLARVLDPGEFEQLKWVYLVGEPVPQAVCDRWASVKQLYNMYGPTEGTCGATIKRLLPWQPVTIGVPNPTTRVYILTSEQTPAPLGAVGELYLAGVQVAGGYLNMPEQARLQFLPDTVWPLGAGEMMYKTGDRGYWTEDGQIVLLGRRDREIKLRGYRLDMGDLEIRIARAYPSLQAVAVTRRDDQLLAVVQPRDTDMADLRDELRKALPQYAMPHIIVAVDRLPVTGAGKVDYTAVSDLALQRQEAPSWSDQLTTPAEMAVAEAYRSALQLPSNVEVTASSDFVDLGGHSLRQLELLRYLSAALDVQLPLRTVLACRTVRDLAKAIEGGVSSRPSLVPDQIYAAGEERATPMETEWMTKYATSAGSSSFNVCSSSTFDGNMVDRRRLIEAWNLVLARHRLLSCLYTSRGGGEVIRASAGYAPQVQTPCSFDLWAEANRPFDLALEQPVRVFITEDRLTVVLSHVVSDYTALGILMREASDAYNGRRLDDPPQSYSGAKVWYEASSPDCLDFWAGHLRDCPQSPNPFGSQPSRLDYSGTSRLSIIDSGTVDSVLQYSVSANVTVQQIAVACVALCLDQSPSHTDIILGVPHINRDTTEDLETFGLFLQPLPVRVTYGASSSMSFTEAVRGSCQMALAHAIPWHQLLQHLNVEINYPNHPLFDVMVTVHDFRHSNELEMKIPGFDSSIAWAEGAKFKLLCELTVLPSGKMLLRLEYDAGVIPEKEIGRIQRTIPLAMRMMAGGAGHEQLKRSLRDVDVDAPQADGLLDNKSFFGKSLRSI